MILFPFLLYLIYRGSIIAGGIFATFLIITMVPLGDKPWEYFQYCWIWDIWCEYFDFSFDSKSLEKLDWSKKHMVFEFPHGIFPMGQFLAASRVKDITPGKKICGIGADIIFIFPIMRHIMVSIFVHIRFICIIKRLIYLDLDWYITCEAIEYHQDSESW